MKKALNQVRMEFKLCQTNIDSDQIIVFFFLLSDLRPYCPNRCINPLPHMPNLGSSNSAANKDMVS